MADAKFSFADKAKSYHPQWMAPEALGKSPKDINVKAADMWSFAILLWELSTREVPFPELSPMEAGMKVENSSLQYMQFRISSFFRSLLKDWESKFHPEFHRTWQNLFESAWTKTLEKGRPLSKSLPCWKKWGKLPIEEKKIFTKFLINCYSKKYWLSKRN